MLLGKEPLNQHGYWALKKRVDTVIKLWRRRYFVHTYDYPAFVWGQHAYTDSKALSTNRTRRVILRYWLTEKNMEAQRIPKGEIVVLALAVTKPSTTEKEPTEITVTSESRGCYVILIEDLAVARSLMAEWEGYLLAATPAAASAAAQAAAAAREATAYLVSWDVPVVAENRGFFLPIKSYSSSTPSVQVQVSAFVEWHLQSASAGTCSD
jgi:hypothetical protein